MNKQDMEELEKIGKLTRDPEIGTLVNKLLADNAKLRRLLNARVIDETELRQFVREGGLTVALEGGAAALIAQAFGKQLYESKAINYIESTFDSPDYPDLGDICVTAQLVKGKTPHQLRKEAEEQVKRLELELQSCEKRCGESRERLAEEFNKNDESAKADESGKKAKPSLRSRIINSSNLCLIMLFTLYFALLSFLIQGTKNFIREGKSFSESIDWIESDRKEVTCMARGESLSCFPTPPEKSEPKK